MGSVNNAKGVEYYEYAGMSYEQASRAAEKILARGWYQNFDRLSALYKIMHSVRR